MKLPFFYEPSLSASGEIELNEETSRHIIQVLRMKVSEPLLLTNGKGLLAECSIKEANRKRCFVSIGKLTQATKHTRSNAIAISLLKNTSRFEWFIEKATEIGIDEIIPLICDRTEKQKYRHERLESILISSMLQSQQVWLPALLPATKFNEVIKNHPAENKFIAHCETGIVKQQLRDFTPASSAIILIGPEGDFTPTEIQAAEKYHFKAISLGETRLRTETAGIVAAVLLQNHQ